MRSCTTGVHLEDQLAGLLFSYLTCCLYFVNSSWSVSDLDLHGSPYMEHSSVSDVVKRFPGSVVMVILILDLGGLNILHRV